MKKIVLLLLLCPFALFAQMYKGTVILANGDTKTGYVEVPKSTASKIKFSETEDGKSQKFKIDEVKGFSHITDGGETRNYLVLEVYNMQKHMRGSKNGKKFWLRMIAEGKNLNLLTLFFDYSGLGNLAGEGDIDLYSGNLFCIQKPGEATCDYVYANTEAEALNVKHFDKLVSNIKDLYGVKWTEFVESFRGDDYWLNGIKQLIIDYDAYTKGKTNDPGSLNRRYE